MYMFMGATTCRFYGGYLRRFMNIIDNALLEIAEGDIAIVFASLICNAGGKDAYFRVLRAFFRRACQETC
jgi:hypothetical protein